jgi:hypothetical protein
MPKQKSTAAIHECRFTLDLPAPPARAWKSLFADIGTWWPRDFHATGSEGRMRFEASLNGGIFEESRSGNGIVWYRIIALDAPNSVTLAGFIAPPWGGPATTLLRLAIEPAGDEKSTLEIHDSIVGNANPADVEAGWRAIFGGFIETLASSGKPT